MIPASIHKNRKNTRLVCGAAWWEEVTVGMDYYQMIDIVEEMDWSMLSVVDTMGCAVRKDTQVLVVHNIAVGRRSSSAKRAAAAVAAAVDCSTSSILRHSRSRPAVAIQPVLVLCTITVRV